MGLIYKRMLDVVSCMVSCACAISIARAVPRAHTVLTGLNRPGLTWLGADERKRAVRLGLKSRG